MNVIAIVLKSILIRNMITIIASSPYVFLWKKKFVFQTSFISPSTFGHSVVAVSLKRKPWINRLWGLAAAFVVCVVHICKRLSKSRGMFGFGRGGFTLSCRGIPAANHAGLMLSFNVGKLIIGRKRELRSETTDDAFELISSSILF